MISDAAVMTNPVSRAGPFSRPPRPVAICRSARSFMSMARGHRISFGSIRSSLPKCRCVSISAASRLCAEVMAWKSPLKCRLILSTGCERRLAAAGGAALLAEHRTERRLAQRRDGVCARRFTRPWVRPMVLTVLPSPLVVGVIAVMRMSLPRRVGKAIEHLEADLGGVAAVGFEQVVGEAEPSSDFRDGSRRFHGSGGMISDRGAAIRDARRPAPPGSIAVDRTVRPAADRVAGV